MRYNTVGLSQVCSPIGNPSDTMLQKCARFSSGDILDKSVGTDRLVIVVKAIRAINKTNGTLDHYEITSYEQTVPTCKSRIWKSGV